MVECIRIGQWIVTVLISNFFSDPVCMDWISLTLLAEFNSAVLML